MFLKLGVLFFKILGFFFLVAVFSSFSSEVQIGIVNKQVEKEDSPNEKKSHPSSNTIPKTHSAVSSLKTSSRHDLAMVFTCKVCETRSVKTACRESYEKGVVVARCDGCNNLHLMADRLGWFGEPGSVEDLLAARGEEVKKGSADTINLTLEDLAGTGTKT